jgi:O-antigen/teichoic acid export membrane protein
MDIDLLALAVGIIIGIPFGVALTYIARYLLTGKRERQKLQFVREMWRESRNASFINQFKKADDERA